MQITKHLGIDSQTKQRVALILTVLPGTEECLVVHIDRLQPVLKDHFLNLMNSHEGQASINFSEVLGRRLHHDSGKPILQVLHESGMIRKVSIDAIEMTPTPSVKLPLRMVLVESKIIARPVGADAEKFNPHNYNSQAAAHGETVGIARNLLVEADMLEEAARSKREEAYRHAPSLRPGAAPVVEEAPVPVAPPLDLTAAYGDAPVIDETAE